jgi:predicted TIM-barrel fold metal-dependent hydrolase
MSGVSSSDRPGRVDTHQHALPDFYLEWLQRHGLGSIGDRAQPSWSSAAATSYMERMGIGTSVLSVATPNVYVGPQIERIDMARRVNDALADLARTSGGRFEFFASVPLPDVDAAVEAARHAIDDLGAAGVICLTHVDGVYISDEKFGPLLEFLDERGAVLFVHPHVPPFDPAPGINPGAADFLLDTVRASIGFCLAGVHERLARLRILLSHAGGFLPFAAARFAAVCGDGDAQLGTARLRRYWFDTALSTSPQALDCLLRFAEPGQVVFGTDWPWAPEPRVRYFTEMFEAYEFAPGVRDAIEWGNARTLIPQLVARRASSAR